MQNQNKQGFTLVELIVVITILAILGTIGFISLQGYSANARDGKRVSDIQLISSSLELFQLNTGKYPEPTNSFEVTYSGSEVRKQGTFGETSFKNVEKLNKIPRDPSTNDEYTYSVLNTKGEYELGSIYESTNGLGSNLLLTETYAGTKNALAMIKGNYNGIFAKVFSGSTTYVLAVPSIINSEIGNVDIIDLIQNKKMVYKGYKNLPSGYKNSEYNINGEEEEDFKLVNSGSILIFSGSTGDLKNENAQLAFISNLQNAYSGTHIKGQPDIDNILKQDIVGGRGGALLISQVLIHDNINKEVEIKALAIGSSNSSSGSSILVKSVDSGYRSTCFVTVSGDLYCWGLNDIGQLGDGTLVNKSTPFKIMSGVSTLTYMENHGCAIKTSGELYCWGQNLVGVLGDGTTVNKSSPTLIASGSLFSSVSTGKYHTCAIKTDGKLYCWGNNSNYELGINNTSSKSLPVYTGTGMLFSKVSSGDSHTCGIVNDGTLYCWGKNTSGEIGDGTVVIKKVATPVSSGGNKFSEISLGNSFTCGITTSGALYCWGNNGYYKLGIGDGNSVSYITSPTLISSGTQFSNVNLGLSHACAVTISGDLYCWGNNALGQVGNGTIENSYLRNKVMSGISNVCSGDSQTCAVTEDGALKCFGRDNYLQFGNMLSTYNPTLIENIFGNNHKIGGYTSCIIDSDSNLKCWGLNSFGQLGDGTIINRITPVQILSSVSKVALSGSHSCAIKTSGELYCWGQNDYGQLGKGDITVPYINPIQITPGNLFSEISLGSTHSCAIKTSGELYCWGKNNYGQLGNGFTGTLSTPTQILTGNLFSKVSLGNSHTCALKTNGELYCWGYNSMGQIGNGNTTHTYNPTQVLSGSLFSEISLGNSHTCAIKTSGELYCWGWNNMGQLGNGNTTNLSTPIQILTGSLFSKISLSGSSCALKTNGELYCWGSNTLGQLCNGTATNSLTPILLTTGVLSVDLGGGNTCLKTTSGVYKCCGDNTYGQLGYNPYEIKDINIQ